MGDVITVGLDLAKSVFQAHGADASGEVVFRKKLRREQVVPFFATQARCLVAMEACASAHHWAREIGSLGHETRLIAPAYVKPFVKRQKNDAADAEAICEAAQRPTMRFVTPKSAEAQGAAVVFRTRDLLVRQRTQLISALRGHLAEFGHIARKGPGHVVGLIELVRDPEAGLPDEARSVLLVATEMLEALQARIAVLDRQVLARVKASPLAHRLMTIPGVGPVMATAMVALAPTPSTFRRGRDFAAWVGLTPRQHSSGGKEKLGRTTKMGERSLRRLLILGASSAARMAVRKGTSDPWLARMLARKPRMLVTVALANKMARIVWALMPKADPTELRSRWLPQQPCDLRRRGGERSKEVWRNVSETGPGKPGKCPSASSAPKRTGPGPRTPYRPAAVRSAASTGRTHGST